MSGGFFEGRDGNIENVPSNATDPTIDNPVDAEAGGLFDTTGATTPTEIPSTGSDATNTTGQEEQSDGGFFDGSVLPGSIETQVGPRGPEGVQGNPGPQGSEGVQGNTGDTGIQGTMGLTGAKGDTGETGAKGDTGETGAQGMQGDAGTGGTYTYFALRTINGTTLQLEDNVTSIPAMIADGWIIIDGLTSDSIILTNDILQRSN